MEDVTVNPIGIDQEKAQRLFEAKIDQIQALLAELGLAVATRDAARELWAKFEELQNELHEELSELTLVSLRDFHEANGGNKAVVLEHDEEDE